MAAILAGEPWCYRPWEIQAVSVTWFYSVILHPRDKEGSLIRSKRIEQVGSGWPEWDEHWRFWRARRLRDDHIERLWQEKVREFQKTQGQG